ncbi:CRISPR-associated helicase Cas3' [Hahella sp. SMD15-11]|uniref:CRISPR-associated helicase Cas3 n=1 Tax=Thermohahella caldifontis TaxID=3142973 RepID=A0AB39UU59_9GAMM
MVEVPAYFKYWGKCSKDESRQFHLLAFHSLDVAAVGWLLLDPAKPLCRRLASQLGVEPEWLRHWFAFLLMFHDLGKFARGFQNLVPEKTGSLVPADQRFCYDIRHDSLGLLLWRKKLSKNLGSRIPDLWLEVVTGHHGEPPLRERRGFDAHFHPEDVDAAEAYVKELLDWWRPDLAPLEGVDEKVLRRVSWQLAGLSVLSDWLGSNQDIFTYRSDVMLLPEYWREVACPTAPRAINLSRWGTVRVSEYQGITQQFPFIETPTPLQRMAHEIPIGEGAQLFILEDVTGAGKTEASMVLVHRLMAAGLGKGLYVGLPTMATANAMYDRLRQSYRALYTPDQTPSLILAHGAAMLDDRFTESVIMNPVRPEADYKEHEQSAGAWCSYWLADNRKKALLADVGVGTVDQALLGVLPARHQSLRLLGLSDKVLLVDEVHSYDPYMRRLLASLLEAHARQGGSAILLSATLPQQFRSELLAGFCKGLGRETPEIQHTGYPLLTHMGKGGLREVELETRPELKRRIQVRRLDSEQCAFELIRESVKAGMAVCWVRNTVNDALTSYRQLIQEGICGTERTTLFHSRFAMVDRQRIEADVIRRFGKAAGAAERPGQVLIATQVVEQSLDLDFDLMITDLAPIDLIVQRAGRLHRHVRDARGNPSPTGQDERPEPTLYVLSPDPATVDSPDWLKILLPGTQAVYQHVGQLWLTAHVLFSKSYYRMPDDARKLIEGVYSDSAQTLIPEDLLELVWRAEGTDRSRQSMAEFNCLRLDMGYTRKAGCWDDEIRIPTRLEESPSVTVALARYENDELVPYANVKRHAWSLSQLSLPERQWKQVAGSIPDTLNHKIEKLKAEQPALRWCEIMPLTTELKSLYSNAGGWNPGGWTHEPD